MGRGKKKKGSKAGGKNGNKNAFSIHDLKDCKTVLILGEGDLSFTHAMLTQRQRVYPREPFKLVLASTYDSHGIVKQKYPTNYVEKVKQYKNVIMKHNVDATMLSQCIFPELPVDKHQKFDAIIFNFPHTGEQRTHLNRNLLRDVFASAAFYLKTSQASHFFLTMKNFAPYIHWNHVESATAAGLECIVKKKFSEKMWPTYVHQTTLLDAKEVDAKNSLTYVFRPSLGKRLFSEVEHRKQLQIEKDRSSQRPADVNSDDYSANGSNTSAKRPISNCSNGNESAQGFKRKAKKRKRKKPTSLLNKDFVKNPAPHFSEVKWTSSISQESNQEVNATWGTTQSGWTS
eukprot:g4201.t1